MRRSVALGVILSSLSAFAQEPPADEPPPGGEPPEPGATEGEPADPVALKALRDGVAFSRTRSYRFKAALDVESGGSPLMSVEVEGEHSGDWLHVRTELLGRSYEAYSDGKRVVSRDGEGSWEGGGKVMRGALSLDALASAVTSARYEEKTAKVGSHQCRVIRATADTDALRQGLGGGKAGQGEVKETSLRFYVDLEDGRLRKVKLRMKADAVIQGAKAEIEIISEQRYTYSKSVTVELPEGVREVLEKDPEPGEGSGK